MRIQTLFEQSNALLVVNAHPDDEIPNAAVIAEAQAFGVPMHGVHLSIGEATTKNMLAAEGFSPELGDREREGIDGAVASGFVSVEQFYGRDSNLAADELWIVPELAAWIGQTGVDLVVSINKIGERDSPDHADAARFAIAAAQMAFDNQEGPQPITVMTLLPDAQGMVTIPLSERRFQVVADIAAANRSQFRTATEPLNNEWVQLSENCYMHPADWQELAPYGLGRPTHYSLQRIGAPVVARAKRRG